MKDCNGNPVHLKDLVSLCWSGGTLVTGTVIALAPNRCRVLVEAPHADNKKVYRYSNQISIVENNHV